ncbi:MAG: glycosyltransferase [Pelagibacterales bacterium]|nr:glycosyltransferase [Pelagibacterales bacterium]
MESHLFTYTNYTSERNSNFYNIFSIKNKTCFNLMGKNKLNSKSISFFIYPLFFVGLIPYSIFKLISNRKVKTYIVLFPGLLEILLLKVFQPIFGYSIIYDMFTSFHLTLVEDRQLVKRGSFLEKIIIALDRLFFTLPDKLIFETVEMKDYVETFLDKNKTKSLVLTSYRELPIGLELTKSASKNDNKTVTFWGSFERMHGLDTILDAAIILGDRYQFILIGDGSYYENIKKRVLHEQIKNVKLTGYLANDSTKKNNLYTYITNADICLGTFSNTRKNNLVIPGKVVEAFLFKKPVITADTMYMRNNCYDSAYLVEPDSPQDLSKSIEILANDRPKIESIIVNSQKYYKFNHTKEYFYKNLIKFLEIK